MPSSAAAARGRLIAQFNAEVEQLDQPLEAQSSPGIGLSALNPERAFLFSSATATAGSPTATRISSMPTPVFDPVPVRIGADPGYSGVVAEPREPHSPIGTSTPPVTAEAYAAPATARGLTGLPLAVDPTALPLRGRHGRLARAPRRGRDSMKAAAEAPKTKVLAGDGEGEGQAEAPEAKAEPEKRHAAAGEAKTRKAAKISNAKISTAKTSTPKTSASKTSNARTANAKTAGGKSAAAKSSGEKTKPAPHQAAKKPDARKSAGAKAKPRVNASN